MKKLLYLIVVCVGMMIPGINQAADLPNPIPIQIVIDDSGSPAVTYIGFTLSKNAQSDPFWQIIKITEINGITTVQYCEGSAAYAYEFTQRTTYTYQ